MLESLFIKVHFLQFECGMLRIHTRFAYDHDGQIWYRYFICFNNR